MTGISTSSPLPIREGLGVGASASARASTLVAGVEASLRSAPTPGPSLAGRGGSGIDTGLDTNATKANLAKAGQQFEAVFTGMMMKAMRATKLADPLFDSKAIDTFRDMQDQKIVQAMAEHTPLGIGKAMTDFLSRALPSATDGQPEINQNAAKPVA